MTGSRLGLALAAVLLGFGLGSVTGAEAEIKGLEVARLERSDPVDFYREILPVLQGNCLPCHNKTTTKADLLLETPADMIKGGESGPAIIPGKAADSLLFQLAAHRQKPRMPPKDNKVNAINLSPRELGLLTLWIDQGAQATGRQEEVVAWQPLAAGVRPILALAVTGDGQLAACGRGNQLDLYHLPTAQRVGRLVDPSLVSLGLPEAAHRDWVSAVAFSPDGQRLASGGFREIKIWERVAPVLQKSGPVAASPVPTNGGWQSPDGSRLAKLGTNGALLLTDAAGLLIAELKGDPESVRPVAVARARADRARTGLERQRTRLEAAVKEGQSQEDRLKRAREAMVTASKALAEKDAALARTRRERLLAEVQSEVALRQAAGMTNAPEYVATADRFKTTRSAEEKAEGEQRTAALKASTTENEKTLAMEGTFRAESVRSRAQRLEQEAGDELRASEAELKALEHAHAASAARVSVAAFSPDGRWLVTADESRRLVCWAATNGVAAESLPLPAPATHLTLDGSWRCGVSTSAESFTVDWTPRWELVATLTNTPAGRLADRIGALTFSPDGRWLASGGGEPSRSGEVWFWDSESRQPVFGLPQLHSDAVVALAFSPDGRWLATGGADRFARLVEVASGRQVRALEGHTGHVLGVGWRADGQTLATAGADLLVKFWDPLTGERRKQSTGFGREVTAVAHLAGTEQWVVASGDAGLRIVNESGERVRALAGADDFTQALAVTSDGKWVMAGGQDGVLRVWSAGEEQPRLIFTP